MANLSLTIDKWGGNISKTETVENPSYDLVKKNLDLLDGHTRTLMTLENNSSLTIGGGNKYFVVYFTDEEGNTYTLTNPENDVKKSIDLVAGGQRGSFSSNICSTKDMVLEAIEAFINENEMNKSLSWTKD